MHTGWKRYVLLVALLLLLTSPLSARELVILQGGQEIGSAEQTVRVQGDVTSLSTYTSLTGGVEVTTMFMFEGSEFPKQPVAYRFDMQSPAGAMVVDMQWQETGLSYEVMGMGRQGQMEGAWVLPLDNSALTDYAVLAWIFDEATGQPDSVSLHVPSQLMQSEVLVPMGLQFNGVEVVDGQETLAYTGDVGVPVHVWVGTEQRQLVKMTIPSQGIEIKAVDTAAQAVVERPWTTMGSFEWVDREVEQAVPGARLTGTLTVPQSTVGDVPGVVLIAGSGPTDRDGNSAMLRGRIDNLKDIAEYLASHGIAVLRYDKRGTGGSELLAQEVPSFREFADDASAMLRLLADEPLVDGEHLYLAGHSEGAVLALLAAEDAPNLAGLLLLSGPGRTMGETVRGQLREQASYLEIMEPEVYSGLAAELERALDLAYAAIAADQPVPYDDFDLMPEFVQFIQSLDVQRRFAKDWLVAEPTQLIADVELPVLILHGLADEQVRPDHAYLLSDSQLAAHLIMVPGVDHVLKYSGGAAVPYNAAGRFVDERILQAMKVFVLE